MQVRIEQVAIACQEEFCMSNKCVDDNDFQMVSAMIYAVCRVNTDVVFVVDSSGSIGADNYQLVRDYVYNFTEGLLNGDTNSRVGIILYSDIADIEIELETRRPALLEEIRNLTYIARFTNTPEGLCLLKSRPWRASVSVLRIAIVLTDGQSNRVSATCMQEGGEPGTLNSTTEEVHTFQPPITVFAVGVANFVEQELLTIASSPDLVDRLDSFDYRLLVQNQQSRSYFICFKGKQSIEEDEKANHCFFRNRTTINLNWGRRKWCRCHGLCNKACIHSTSG